MLKLIGSIFRYTCLILTILTLSHIVQIKGFSVSRHVENTLNWVGALSPARTVSREVSKVTREVSSAIQEHVGRSNQVERMSKDAMIEDAEVSRDDARELNHVIQKAKKH